ncbi:MAG: hypothetical protein WA977_08390 [Halobacteriota archaeon]
MKITEKSKTKIPESKTSFVETGKVELNFRVPNLLPGAIIHIVRDMRRTLENCANLNLLNEFIETRIVEYEEVSVKEAN